MAKMTFVDCLCAVDAVSIAKNTFQCKNCGFVATRNATALQVMQIVAT